jgi:hypothetical protein
MTISFAPLNSKPSNLILQRNKYKKGARAPFSYLLPEPWTNIILDFEAIIKAFQDVRYIGELRQRWNEIKKLQNCNIQQSNLRV